MDDCCRPITDIKIKKTMNLYNLKYALFISCSFFALSNNSFSANEHNKTKMNWHSRFTFEGQLIPGPFGKDIHVWVYTKEFSERFGMPKKWISNELKGVSAAAWRRSKTGEITCGWGGNKDACKDEEADVLELYFDTTKVNLNWAPWSKEVDNIQLGPNISSVSFLTSQRCEQRRTRTNFPGIFRKKDPCWIYGVRQQPFSVPDTGSEILLFSKATDSKRQGNYNHVIAYDKNAFPSLAWIQIPLEEMLGKKVHLSLQFLVLKHAQLHWGKL